MSQFKLNSYRKIILVIGVVFTLTLILSSFVFFQRVTDVPKEETTYSGYQGSLLYGGSFFEANYGANEPFLEQGLLTIHLAFHNYLNQNITNAQVTKLQIIFIFADQLHNELNYTLIKTLNANFTLLPGIHFENSQDVAIPYAVSFPLDSKELGIQIIGSFQIFSNHSSKAYTQQDMVNVMTNIPLVDRISVNTDPSFTFLIISQIMVVIGCIVILSSTDIRKTWILLVIGLSLFTVSVSYPIISLQPVHTDNHFTFSQTFYLEHNNTKVTIHADLTLSPLIKGKFYNGTMNVYFSITSNYTYTGMQLTAFFTQKGEFYSNGRLTSVRINNLENISRSTTAELHFTIMGFTPSTYSDSYNPTNQSYALYYSLNLIHFNGTIYQLNWGLPSKNITNSSEWFVCPIYGSTQINQNLLTISLFFGSIIIYSVILTYLKKKTAPQS